MIRVRGLSKSFRLGGREVAALRDVSFGVDAGEFIAVMGPSGAGKSTLLHLVGGLDRPTRGEVLLRGRNLFGMPADALPAFRNRHIGFVFQFHYLLSEFTAFENVRLPLMIGGAEQDDPDGRARTLLERVGLSERMDHKPGELSGGEQQRVAIARALVTGPDLVLADEPTGNLDTRTGGEVFALLRDINRETGTTFVIVTHNEALAASCDRVIRMLDGRIVNGKTD